MENNIAKEETRKIAKPIAGLSLIWLGILIILGQFSVETIIGVVVGCIFVIFLFAILANSAQKSTNLSPAQATRYVQRGYAIRYMLTAAYIICVIRLPYVNWVAAVVPLFFPKVILLIYSIFKKKGG